MGEWEYFKNKKVRKCLLLSNIFNCIGDYAGLKQRCNKVEVPNLMADLSRTPIFKWYVVRCGSNRYQKHVCFKEIGLRAQKMITILGSIVNIIESDLHDHFMSTRIFTLAMNEIFI